MAKIEIYTKPYCPYCERAKALLEKKGADYTEIVASHDADLRAEMNKRSGRLTYPQIFIDDLHVGGCDDLMALDQRGRARSTAGGLTQGMSTLELALVQLTTPADQAAALSHARPLIEAAAGEGAQLIALPECANLVEQRKEVKAGKLVSEDDDVFILGVRELARDLKVTILIGSAIVRAENSDKAANRALLIGPDGHITARYDKMHLFDADTPDGKSYRESNTMRPGAEAVVAQTPWGGLGLSICYDVRFAYLYRALAKRDAQMIAVPAAFTVPTGLAHWEVMLRARAIETGAFVLAPAQGGQHEDGRTTYGHSLVVAPWGEVIAKLDHDRPAILRARLDFSEVAKARQALPQLRHDREFV